jgi:DNA gyrase subunit A
MSRRKTGQHDGEAENTAESIQPVDSSMEQILDTDVVAELEASFLEYSMSVIVARALPDVRDGLKPVHRRVLYSLFEQGIRPGTPHKKCARVVGDVMGKYHPHGDSSIYEALVRMAQPWSMQMLLVDGHGNFGSPDDGPAAMRYTECRMSPPAFAMVEELDEDTVELVPNYDQTEHEPEVLPARIPNLLVNGSTGIAVGMATNMAPHNLVEVVAGLRAMLADPKIDLDQMMQYIPGPDFPTGGLLIGAEGIRDAYTAGRGQFRIRAKTRVEDISARRKGVIVTELPYNVGPEKVIAKIKDLSAQKRLNGVADVKDLTDRKTGLRLVIEIKAGFTPAAVLDELYRLTPLEESFSVNNVALVNGEPRTLGILDLCREFISHRLEVVRRRSEHRKSKAEARAHIVEGLVLALASIDEVVALIKSSKDAETARTKLMKTFTLSEIQANAILEMTLRRLTSLEVNKLKSELKELRALITELKKLLASPKLMSEMVGNELSEVASSFGTPRRSALLSPDQVVAYRAEPAADEPCTVTLSTSGMIARTTSPLAAKPSCHQVVAHQVATTGAGQVGVITSRGRLVRLAVSDIPLVEGRAVGAPIREMVDIETGELVVSVIPLSGVLSLVTAEGVLKRITSESFPVRSGGNVICLRPGDEVVGAVSLPTDSAETADLLIVTGSAQLLRTPAGAVRAQGSSASGVAGIRLSDNDRVIALGSTVGTDPLLVTLSDAGSLKMTPVAEYPAKGRGTGGVRCQTFRKNESRLVAVWIGDGPVYGSDTSGAPVALSPERSKRDASGNAMELTVSAFGSTRR